MSSKSDDTHRPDYQVELNKLRSRLLDLTARNRLLNYPHPRGRSLRFIETDPVWLYDRLLSGNSVRVQHVPAPPRGQALEREWPDWVAKNGRDVKPKAHEWAKFKGYRTDYELSELYKTSSGGGPGRRGARVQTLMYPEDLERQVSRMAQLARTAIEDSGANILYVAFGFLGWQDQAGSSTYLAPLLLVPVQLTRSGYDDETRRKIYSIQHTGEDIQTNLSLKQKLSRDFGLDLPELEDDDNVQSYLRKCGALLKAKPDWTIKHFASLGFFQFGKLLLYLDLDPARWPPSRRLDQHRVVSKVLGGGGGESDFEYSAQYSPDQIESAAPEFRLVHSADSSQHSVVVDAARGSDLVVEGPPGTGKSQTITNIIGVALKKGQSVLFVSEKMAALDVVRTRLDAIGLGEFCLELHSHRTQRSKLLKDIESRIQRGNAYAEPKGLEREVDRYERLRDRLNAYARLINQDVPGFDFSVHDLLWSVSRLRNGGDADAGIIDDVPESAERLTQRELDDAVERINAILARRRIVQEEFPELQEHPLQGLALTPEAESTWEPHAERLRTILRHMESLRDAARRLSARSDANIPDTVEELGVATVLSRALANPEDTEASVQLGRLVDGQRAADEFLSYLEDERRLTEARETASAVWTNDVLDEPRTLKTRCESIRALGEGVFEATALSLEGLQRVADSARGVAEIFAENSEDFTRMQQMLDVTVPRGVAGLRAADEFFDLLAEMPGDALDQRSKPLESIHDVEPMERLAQEQKALNRDVASLDLRFRVEEARKTPSLAAAAELIGQKALVLGVFDSEWRAANGLYKSLSRGKPLLRSSEKRAADLRALESLSERLTSFERNPDYTGLLGKAFNGLDTPVDHYVRLVEWYGKVRAWAGRWFQYAPTVIQSVMRIEVDAARQLRELEDVGLRKAIQQAIWHLDQMQYAAGEYLAEDWFGSWEQGASVADRLSANLHGNLPDIRNALRGEEVKPADAFEAAKPYLRILGSVEHQERRRQYLAVTPPLKPLDEKTLEALSAAATFSGAVWDTRTPDEARLILQQRKDSHAVAPLLHALKETDSLLENYASECGPAIKSLGVTECFCTQPLADAPFTTVIERVEKALQGEASFSTWRDFVLSLHPRGDPAVPWPQLGDGLMVGELADEQAKATLKLGLLSSLANRLVQDHEVLRDFESLEHEDLRQNLKDVDERLWELHREEIAAAAAQRRPPAGNGVGKVREYTEMHLLRHEIGKKRGHVPIRRLTTRAGGALTALKPCFMMGPLSVAQYLTPGELEFDLLIMDEASQMRPEDALGAIARAKQVVVVGDPKQLPPTSFFDRLEAEESEDEDEETVIEGKESILELLMPALGRVRQLNWHYRSQHESLIAFSNYKFYDDRLWVFPSPKQDATSGSLGITYHYVDEGEYSKQKNLPEAQEVLRGVLREIRRSRGRRTVGVVAMNSQQAELLSDEWARLIREHPDQEALIDAWVERNEPFFIKNLENVQGDERDVIFISLTYGKDRNGHVFQRFGPINQRNGWRRLNVLFTRAKQNMVVYSSMRSTEVTPSPGNVGATALRDFLEYCEKGGVLSEPVADSGREPDSPFEVEVAEALNRHGYVAVPQVGVAGFYIDIGVRHPEFGEEFILGVECDGATYHSAKSARDRDHLRQEILEGLGWRIHRIWSADWYNRRDREVRRLVDAVNGSYAKAAEALEEREQAPSRTVDIGVKGAGEDAQVQEPAPTHDAPREKGAALDQAEAGELKESLRRLRKTIDDEFPDVPEDRNLLHDDIIRLLVEHQPVTREAFAAAVPARLRSSIDRDQARNYLGTVLSLCEDYAG